MPPHGPAGPAGPSPSPLDAVAAALGLDTYAGPGPWPARHAVFRGSLRAFAAALTRAYVSHGERTGPDGPAVCLPGLVARQGDLGGVLITESAYPEGEATTSEESP